MKNTNASLAGEARQYHSALLVDDDSYSLALTQITLEALGVRGIVTAEDGMTGMRVFDRMQPKPDLVVCDLFMPDKDGIEFINELGDRQYRGAIILMTAGDLSILEMATKVAVRGNGLTLLGAFPKPLHAATVAHVLGLAAP